MHKWRGIKTGGMILFFICLTLAVCFSAWEAILPYLPHKLDIKLPDSDLILTQPMVDPDSLFNESLIPPKPNKSMVPSRLGEPKTSVHLNYPPLPNDGKSP
jgi:hypothetical protein